MKSSALGVVVAGSVALAMTGCGTKNAFSYRAPFEPLPPTTQAIVGLPLTVQNATLTPAQCAAMEREIDAAMQAAFGAQYRPITATRGTLQEMAEPIAAGLASPVGCRLLLENQRTNLASLAAASGCRYALVPQLVGHEASAQWGFDVFYVIPVGYIILVGHVPFPVGALSVEHMPVYTVALIDLEKASVAAEEVYAWKTDLADESLTFPRNPIQRLKKGWARRPR
jgi:hypothetical protein